MLRKVGLLLSLGIASVVARDISTIDSEIHAVEQRLRLLEEERASAAAAVSGQAKGQPHHSTDASGNDVYYTDAVDGVDVRYYRNNNSDRVDTPNDGVTLRRWLGRRNSSVMSLAFAAPFVTRIDLKKGSTYPASGQYWLPDSAYYVVVSGNVTFGAKMQSGYCYLKYSSDGITKKSGSTACVLNANRTTCDFTSNSDIQNNAGGASATAFSRTDCCAACAADMKCKAAVFVPASTANVSTGDGELHSWGDVYWVQAGQPHGPITNVGDSDLQIFVVGDSASREFVPITTTAPSNSNPSISAAGTAVSFRQADGTWRPNPSPHSEACTSKGGVSNMNFDSSADAPPVLMVHFNGECKIPYHYHPTGAMYFVVKGNMAFKGDYVGYDPQITLGELRWVRPGWDYGPEENVATNAEMQITVLGTDSPPTFAAPPNGPFKVQQTRELSHVWQQ